MATAELETLPIMVMKEFTPDLSARFDATPEQLTHLARELGPLHLRGDELGCLNDRGKFEVLLFAA